MNKDVTYEGSESMNSLKHLDVPVVTVGRMDGEELRSRDGDNLRKIYVKDGQIVGYRLTGDIRNAGIYRVLMNKEIDVSPFRDKLLDPNFGMGYIKEMSIIPGIEKY